jgi:hypothetical protein
MPHPESGDYWNAGYEAYSRNLTLTHCPYFHGQPGYISWRDGWFTAYDDDVTNAENEATATDYMRRYTRR